MPRWATASIISLFLCGSAQAVIIEFETELVSGPRFRTTYTVTNDSLSSPLELFDIEFDTSLYDELSLTPVSGADVTGAWSELILGSAPGVPALYDAFALDEGIAPGGTFGGFAIEYVWLGASSDAFRMTQPFVTYDPITFAVLETGTTTHRNLSVPEPGTMALLLAGLAVMGLRRRGRPRH